MKKIFVLICASFLAFSAHAKSTVCYTKQSTSVGPGYAFLLNGQSLMAICDLSLKTSAAVSNMTFCAEDQFLLIQSSSGTVKTSTFQSIGKNVIIGFENSIVTLNSDYEAQSFDKSKTIQLAKGQYSIKCEEK
jgi:hypothetical protein